MSYYQVEKIICSYNKYIKHQKIMNDKCCECRAAGKLLQKDTDELRRLQEPHSLVVGEKWRTCLTVGIPVWDKPPCNRAIKIVSNTMDFDNIVCWGISCEYQTTSQDDKEHADNNGCKKWMFIV